MCQVWLKLAHVLPKNDFFINVFSVFRYHIPLEMGVVLHLKKNLESLTSKNDLQLSK